MSLIFRPILSKISSDLIRSFVFNHKNYSCGSKKTIDEKCAKKIPYVMCPPMLEEFETVLDITNRIYFREDPSLKFLGITMNKSLEKQISDKLNEGLSVIAKCKYTGRIVAIALNETIKPWEHEIMTKHAKEQEDEKTREMLMFWANLTKLANPFQGDPCLYEIFRSCVLYIDKNEQKFGLGRMLAKECVNKAIRQKYKKITCRVTNARYAETLRQLGFEQLLHMPFDTYKNEKGVRVFEKVPLPNIGVRIFSMHLTDMQEFEVV